MNINLRAPINHMLGYGHVGINILHELSKTSDLSFWQIGNVKEINKKYIDSVSRSMGNQATYDVHAPSLLIWHEFHLAERIGSGLHTTMSFFEKDIFDDRTKNHLNSADIIFSTSKWSTKILEENGIRPTIMYCPVGVDTEIFKPREVNKHEPYIFFNLAKIEIRKGHDILVKMFNDAFTESDNVELWISWHNPFMSKEETEKWIAMYKNSPLGHKIKLLNQTTFDEDLSHLMNNVDCGIFPTRAEGFGLPLLQMIACGKPVITTDYSAHTDFCTKETSNLVTIDEIEEAYDGKWFLGHSNWAKIGDSQYEQFVTYMRECYKNRPTNEAGIEKAKEFNWTSTCNIIEETFEKCGT